MDQQDAPKRRKPKSPKAEPTPLLDVAEPAAAPAAVLEAPAKPPRKRRRATEEDPAQAAVPAVVAPAPEPAPEPPAPAAPTKRTRSRKPPEPEPAAATAAQPPALPAPPQAPTHPAPLHAPKPALAAAARPSPAGNADDAPRPRQVPSTIIVRREGRRDPDAPPRDLPSRDLPSRDLPGRDLPQERLAGMVEDLPDEEGEESNATQQQGRDQRDQRPRDDHRQRDGRRPHPQGQHGGMHRQGGHPQQRHGQHRHNHQGQHANNGHRPQGQHPQQDRGERNDHRHLAGPATPAELVTVTGVLEVNEKGHGVLRDPARFLNPTPNDPQISQRLLAKLRLRGGVTLECKADARRGQGPAQVVEVLTCMGVSCGQWLRTMPFDELQVIDPRAHLSFETPGGPLGMRVVDLMCPIGRGSRGLIVAPPRSGKTILMQQMAQAVAQNHPDVRLMVALVDERPEEVTDMRRNVKGEVIASSNDQRLENHVRISRLAIEKAKRHVEMGEHVLILMDSLTRLGRTFNSYGGSSGRTMTGGLDIKALEEPKRMFGAARNCEGGGSLTIVATCLVDTGSKADEFIFQEFKGTGNMEIVLDREMANRRVFPAIDLQASGTRKEHLLLGEDVVDRVGRHIRRRLLDMRSNADRMEQLLKMMAYHKTNEDLLSTLPR